MFKVVRWLQLNLMLDRHFMILTRFEREETRLATWSVQLNFLLNVIPNIFNVLVLSIGVSVVDIQSLQECFLQKWGVLALVKWEDNAGVLTPRVDNID